jgi:hypothetical protein
MFNDMFEEDKKERGYCKHCAARIGRALAKDEYGGDHWDKLDETEQATWSKRGKVAMIECLAIMEDEGEEHGA